MKTETKFCKCIRTYKKSKICYEGIFINRVLMSLIQPKRIKMFQIEIEDT